MTQKTLLAACTGQNTSDRPSLFMASMKGTTSIRLTLIALLTASAVSAHAGLRLECPIRWDLVARINGANPDADLFGVLVRDWKPEYLDQLKDKDEECIAKEAVPESMKKAERREGQRQYAFIKARYVEARGIVGAREELRNQIASAISRDKLTQVTLERDGLPKSIEIIYRPTGRATITCDTLRQGIGYATPESYRQALGFARLCQQTQQAETKTVSILERQASGVAALYGAIDAYAKQADDVTKHAPVPDARLKELTAMRDHVLEQMKSLELPDNDGDFMAAQKKHDAMQAQLDAKACDGMYSKVGMPKAWKANYILLEVNSPESFLGLVCAAFRNGAQVRYLSGGLTSAEGFEFKSVKRTVQIFTVANRIPGGDPSVQMLVPVMAKIDGTKVEVSRANLRAVAVELVAAMTNR